MFSRIFLDVRLQLRRAQNLDIIGQSAVEPAHTGKVIDSGFQNPVGAFPRDVLGCQRIFLQQEILCSQAEAKFDLLFVLDGF